MPEDTVRANQACGKVIAQTLSRLGVSKVVCSPGSRSTPLVLGFDGQPDLELISLLDERSAGFFALGLAKRCRAPIALVCTSGTAAANLLPAVIEANLSQIPLILLTADRPSELRDCRAGQAIDQVKIYGSHVRHFHELGIPVFTITHLAYVRQTLVHAVNIATSHNRGPVHLNLPFREPFFNSEELPEPPMPEGFDSDIFFQQVRPTLQTGSTLNEIPRNLFAQYRRILLTTGENPSASSLTQLSEKLSAPIITDPCSPLRETTNPNRILRYENLLREKTFRASHVPDAVVSIGPLPACKTLRSWLEELDAPTFLVQPCGQNPDPLHRRAMFLSWDPKLLADSIDETKADPNWLSSWNEAESRVEERLDDAFAQLAEPFEGKVARILSEALPDACDLFIANSMPIRDVEWFWKPSSGKRRLHSNRGANGIDGTLSTAIGIAHASDSPSYLLTGDLAFLHDSNGLLATHQFSGNLTIIVINNHGGGIFENLPVSQLASFEKYFATPQKAEIAGIAKVHGISYEKVCEPEDLRTIVENPSQQGIRILEVETNRKTDVTARKLLLDIGPSN